MPWRDVRIKGGLAPRAIATVNNIDDSILDHNAHATGLNCLARVALVATRSSLGNNTVFNPIRQCYFFDSKAGRAMESFPV